MEQDDRLTNNELRIEKLEKMINDPIERINELEKKVAALHGQLKNKVNIQDLYNELMKKADLNSLKQLEGNLIRLNEIVNDLHKQFADRVENDKAHKLLQKNLKNLYDLFLSIKGEGTEDDPMFTTKRLQCASCTKGVQNMIGLRADHTNWNNFPFKEPGVRMSKQGQGFSKLYSKSHYEGSYFGMNSMGARQTSIGDNVVVSNEAMPNPNTLSQGGLKKIRPMTAKVNRKGMY